MTSWVVRTHIQYSHTFQLPETTNTFSLFYEVSEGIKCLRHAQVDGKKEVDHCSYYFQKSVFASDWVSSSSAIWLIWGRLILTSSGDLSQLRFRCVCWQSAVLCTYTVCKAQENKLFNTHFKVLDVCPFLIQSIAAGGHLLTISTLLPKAGSQLPFRIQESYLIHLCKSKPTALYCWIYVHIQYILKWDTLED